MSHSSRLRSVQLGSNFGAPSIPDLSFNNPAQHAIQIVDTLAGRYPSVPAIVVGDLNSRIGGDTMNFLLEQGELLGRVSPVGLYDFVCALRA